MATEVKGFPEQVAAPASLWRRWLDQPQRVWLRRALFQVHLWVGIGIGLYIFLISVSGSAVVYRREINRKYGRPPVVMVLPSGRMTSDALGQRAQALYPGFAAGDVYLGRRATSPATVTLVRGKERVERFFDPYTGADLRPVQMKPQKVVEFFTDLHDNLLMGATGRMLNGIGAILVTLLAMTGLVIWWPGSKNWKRSLTIKWNARFARLNWDMHSALGFWCSLMILMWGVSGIYFSFPDLFNRFFGDETLSWLARLHFGRMGWFAEIVWTIAGLIPAALFVTGFLMWWNRKLRKSFISPNDTVV
jgi:uncharacterized iron-regulated membrane protein